MPGCTGGVEDTPGRIAVEPAVVVVVVVEGLDVFGRDFGGAAAWTLAAVGLGDEGAPVAGRTGAGTVWFLAAGFSKAASADLADATAARALASSSFARRTRCSAW